MHCAGFATPELGIELADLMKVEDVSDVLSTKLGFVIFAGNADEVKRDLWRYVFGIDLRAAW
jgi:hypothetical protein